MSSGSIYNKLSDRLKPLLKDFQISGLHCVTGTQAPKMANVSSGQPYLRLIFHADGRQKITAPTPEGMGVYDFYLNPGEVLIIGPGSWVFAHPQRDSFNNLGIRLCEEYLEVFENDEYSWPFNRYQFAVPFTSSKELGDEIQTVMEFALKHGKEGRQPLGISYARLMPNLLDLLLERGVPANLSQASRELMALQDLFFQVSQNVEATSTKQKLAERYQVSTWAVDRFFREKTGLPFRDYTLKVRMDYACDLLRHPQLTLLQVANSCGYSSTESFIHAFKKYYGVPPHQMRRDLYGEIKLNRLREGRQDGFEVLEVKAPEVLETLEALPAAGQAAVQMHFLNAGTSVVYLHEVLPNLKLYNHGLTMPGGFKRMSCAKSTWFVIRAENGDYLGCFQLGQRRGMAVFGK